MGVLTCNDIEPPISKFKNRSEFVNFLLCSVCVCVFPPLFIPLTFFFPFGVELVKFVRGQIIFPCSNHVCSQSVEFANEFFVLFCCFNIIKNLLQFVLNGS